MGKILYWTLVALNIYIAFTLASWMNFFVAMIMIYVWMFVVNGNPPKKGE